MAETKEKKITTEKKAVAKTKEKCSLHGLIFLNDKIISYLRCHECTSDFPT